MMGKPARTQMVGKFLIKCWRHPCIAVAVAIAVNAIYLCLCFPIIFIHMRDT